MVLTKDITQMVKDNAKVYFAYYSDGNLVYTIHNPVDDCRYGFSVPISETKGGIFLRTDRALYYIRWIRKAIQTNQFTKVL